MIALDQHPNLQPHSTSAHTGPRRLLLSLWKKTARLKLAIRPYCRGRTKQVDYSAHLGEEPPSSLISPGAALVDGLSAHAERLWVSSCDGERASLFASRTEVKTLLTDRAGSLPLLESGAAYLSLFEGDASMFTALTLPNIPLNERLPLTGALVGPSALSAPKSVSTLKLVGCTDPRRIIEPKVFAFENIAPIRAFMGAPFFQTFSI
jgi:hypothetical protein